MPTAVVTEPFAGPPPRSAALLASDLLPLLDIGALLLVAWFALRWVDPVAQAVALTPAVWFATLLAPFILYDAGFGAQALRGAPGNDRDLLRAHGRRFALYALLVLVLGKLSGAAVDLPDAALLLWLTLGLLATTLTRMLAAATLHRLRREDRLRGILTPDPEAQHPPLWHEHFVANRVAVSLLAERPIERWGAVVKRLEDLLIGGALALLLLPLLALIALAIKLESPGPVLFRQRRHALDNREFGICKFRSMRHDLQLDEGTLQQTRRGDPRITRIGRILRAASLDELPQLFNVLQGTMSLVGPRPHATQMRTADLLGSEITPEYAHRHRVKPGITGWAQVNGARGATETTAQMQRRVELDLHYIGRWSLGLDLRILVLTVGVVLRRTNAF